jgi:hypothetical protein
VQVLDLGIFAITKRKMSSIRLHSEFSSQTNQIIKIFSGLQSAANPPNIRSAFDAAGIGAKVVQNQLITVIEPWRAKAVRHDIVDCSAMKKSEF